MNTANEYMHMMNGWMNMSNEYMHMMILMNGWAFMPKSVYIHRIVVANEYMHNTINAYMH